MTNIRKQLAEIDEDILLLEDLRFDKAIIGLVHRYGETPTALYDEKKCIEIITQDFIENGEDEEEAYESALDWFAMHTSGGWNGEYTPHFAVTLEQ